MNSGNATTHTEGGQYQKRLFIAVDASRAEYVLDVLQKLGPFYSSGLVYNSTNGLIQLKVGVTLTGLIGALNDESCEIRRSAAKALGNTSPVAVQAVPYLIQALGDQDSEVRKFASEALAHIAVDAIQAAQDLVKALENPDARIKEGAANAIVWLAMYIDRVTPLAFAIPNLISLMQDANPVVQERAATAVQQIAILNEAPRLMAAVVPNLVKELKHPNPEVRRRMAVALYHIGGNSAVPALVELLKDENVGVKDTALYSLGQMKEQAISAIPSIVETLKTDGNPKVRAQAASSLGLIDKSGVSLLELISALRDEAAAVKASAAVSLELLVEKGVVGMAAAILDLISLLQYDKVSEVRWQAASALGCIDKSGQAVPLLREALRDEDLWLPSFASTALGRIGGPAIAAIPDLITTLHHTNERVRRAVALALGQMGEKAAPAVPVIMEIWPGEKAYIQKDMIKALGNIGQGASSALPFLEKALCHQYDGVRNAAAQAMHKINLAKLARISEGHVNMATAFSSMDKGQEQEKIDDESEFSIEVVGGMEMQELISLSQRGGEITYQSVMNVANEFSQLHLAPSKVISIGGGANITISPEALRLLPSPVQQQQWGINY